MADLHLHRVKVKESGELIETDTLKFEITRYFSDTIEGQNPDEGKIRVPLDIRTHRLPDGDFVRSVVLVRTSQTGPTEGFKPIEKIQP